MDVKIGPKRSKQSFRRAVGMRSIEHCYQDMRRLNYESRPKLLVGISYEPVEGT